MKDYGRLESIQVKLNKWRQESRDPNFTQYLNQMQITLDKQCASARYLDQELDQKYRQYLQYFRTGYPTQSGEQSGVFSNGGINGSLLESIREKINRLKQESQDPNFTEYLEKMQTVLDNQNSSALNLEQEIDSKHEQYLQLFPQQVQQQFVQAQQVPQWVNAPAPKKKNSVEYKIGADVFCVIGILFILIAFVMMGINYMGDLFKGVCLYGVSGALILVSELILRRRADKLSQAVTGLGICSLYATTMINCVLWENFNSLIAAVITVVITVLAIFISRKKDSVILKLISFLGCYISFWPASGLGNNVDFAVLTVVLFATGIVSVLVPVKKHELGVHITHLITNTVFALAFTYRGWYFDTDMRLCCLFMLSNILLIGLIFKAMIKCVHKKMENGANYSDLDYAVLYSIMLFLQSVSFVLCVYGVKDSYFKVDFNWSNEIWGHICMLSYIVLALVMFAVFAKSAYKWVQYYAIVIVAFFTYGMWGEDASFVISILAIFIVTKILARLKALRVGDVVITSITAFITLFYLDSDEWYIYAFVAAFALSILALKYFKVFHQTMITCIVVLFVTNRMWEISLLSSVIVGVLFLFLLIFNHVRFWRDKNQKVYNGINVALMAVSSVGALYAQDYLNSIILALLGTAVIVLAFREQYEMEFKGKYLLLAIFWTYMVFASGIKLSVIVSSIIMVIAILCVIVGFVAKQKPVRVYGLILSMVISFKIMFYDFSSTPIMERMLLFFVVGVIILAISCIYIVLEKKMTGRGETL